MVKEIFDFRSTRNGTRVITRGVEDFQSVRSHFDTNNLYFYSFYTKSEKPMKALISHLLHYTLPKYISDGPASLVLDVISAKEMAATSQSPP